MSLYYSPSGNYILLSYSIALLAVSLIALVLRNGAALLDRLVLRHSEAVLKSSLDRVARRVLAYV